MNDEKGNTAQDRRVVALSEDHERRHFIEQFLKDHPGTDRGRVEEMLDDAAAAIAPSEARDKLRAELERRLRAHAG